MRRRRRLFAAAAGVLLLLPGCSVAGNLRQDRAAAEVRTCASLVERIAGRALARGDVEEPRSPGKEPLHPATLIDDPEAFYEALAERVTPEHFNQGNVPRGSSASRVINRCRAIAG